MRQTLYNIHTRSLCLRHYVFAYEVLAVNVNGRGVGGGIVGETFTQKRKVLKEN